MKFIFDHPLLYSDYRAYVENHHADLINSGFLTLETITYQLTNFDGFKNTYETVSKQIDVYVLDVYNVDQFFMLSCNVDESGHTGFSMEHYKDADGFRYPYPVFVPGICGDN